MKSSPYSPHVEGIQCVTMGIDKGEQRCESEWTRKGIRSTDWWLKVPS